MQIKERRKKLNFHLFKKRQKKCKNKLDKIDNNKLIKIKFHIFLFFKH